jgi:hypothetical protein
VADTTPAGIIATRRDDIVAAIARQAPPLSGAARARIASLLKPQASQ